MTRSLLYIASMRPAKKVSRKAGDSASSRRGSSLQTSGIEHEGIGRRATLLTGEWLDLARSFGGVIALAEAIGVHYSTLNRWAAHGANIPKATQQLIRILAAQRGVKPPV